MKFKSFLLCLLSLTASLAGAEVFETIDAVVNNEPVFSTEVDQLIQSQFTADQLQSMSTETLDRARRAALNIRINDLLILQEVRKRLKPEQQDAIRRQVEEQTNKSLEQAKKQFARPEDLVEQEKRSGMSWQDLRQIEYERQYRQYVNQIVPQLFTRNLVSKPTPEEVEKFRQENPDIQDEGEILAAHVLLKVPENASTEKEEEVKYMAQQVAAKARAGESFERLAQLYSEHEATKNSGGALPAFRRGEMYSEFNQLFSMSVNEISDPIRTPAGFHVVKILRKKTIEDQVFEKKWQQATREWINGLRKSAVIRVRQGAELTDQPLETE